MSTSRKGKRVAVVLAAVVVVGLPVAAWLAWPRIQEWYQFWRLFESLSLNEQGFAEYRHRRTGIVMVRLPGGIFWMGAQKEDPEGRNYDPEAAETEGPVHTVTLSPFLLGKYEVTQAQWHAVMGNYPSYFGGTKDRQGLSVSHPENRDRLPVEHVSWDDIQEFEEAAGLMLPTEAQWEYACRAGSAGSYCCGGDEQNLGEYCWHKDNSGRSARPAGQKPPNDFGLHDMHGNLWEWCEDVFIGDFYSTADAAKPDPLCTSGSGYRVSRGGSWINGASYCRSARRIGYIPKDGYDVLGFRPAAPFP